MSGQSFGPREESSRSKSKSVMKKTSLRAGIWILVIVVTLSLASARPTVELQRQKRQSDQRIAELETLLALQKYGQHRLREWGRGRELAPPGYGLIDFDKIGRKKKSTRFSPGEENEGGKIWAASWLLPLTSHHQQFDTRNSPTILEAQVDQK